MHRRPFCRRWLMLSILWSWKKNTGSMCQAVGQEGTMLSFARMPGTAWYDGHRVGLSTTVTSEYSHARRSFSQVLVPSQMLPISSFCMRYRRPSSLVFWRRHLINHHRTAIIIYAWYMEVQFNNERLNIMFVFLIVSCPNFPWLIPKQVSITIVAFINIHIATHDDAIKGHVTLFSECVVPFLTYISSNPNTLGNSFIWRLDSSQMHFTLSGIFRQKTRMREYEKQKYTRRQN